MHVVFWWVNLKEGRPMRIWEDNIKMDLREVGWGTWTGSVWLRVGTGGGAVVNAMMSLRVPKMRGIF
jgi:hypothetical protein